MMPRKDGVYETLSGRRYVVVGVAYNCKTNKQSVVFYRQRRRDEWFTTSLKTWQQTAIKYVGQMQTI